MYQASDQTGFGGGGGGGVTLTLNRALPAPRSFGRAVPVAPRLRVDVLPDLGIDIGSRGWWRGAATCLGLCVLTLALAPGFHPLVVPAPAPMSPAAREEARAQSIAPLAWGADSGKRMAATDAVQPLLDTPERPQIDLTATLGQGDGLARALERAGVAGGEAGRVAAMIADVVDPDAIPAGTMLAITLGRRGTRTEARPLQALALRARFDMRVAFDRVGGALAMRRTPIAVDASPLHVEGQVGDSLYAAARAAGAPPKAVEAYIRALAPKVSMDNIEAGDRFSMVVEQQRAATGEVRYGKLLFVGLARGERMTRMIEWTIDGQTDWFDSAGVSQSRGGFVMPVAGARVTSGYGMRRHPLLGFERMHQGIDYGVPYGTPIRAVTDGVVAFAGWHGGHGNMVKLGHAGGLGTGYAHMSSVAVAAGARVARGQVIGYVGSTGLSSGAHLHFEVYRSGVPVSPSSVSFQSQPLLQGDDLAAFRSRLNAIVTGRQQLASR